MSMSDLSVQELWSRYSRERSLELKNELVMRYLSQVKRIVMRMMKKYRAYSNYDDMLSCAGGADGPVKSTICRARKFEYTPCASGRDH